MMAVKMALRSIGANKMRAALTMLGIIIGVMALVVLVSLVDSATSSITSEVSSLGSSLLTVRVSDDKGVPV
jgi:putative ABC transport system permease protein